MHVIWVVGGLATRLAPNPTLTLTLTLTLGLSSTLTLTLTLTLALTLTLTLTLSVLDPDPVPPLVVSPFIQGQLAVLTYPTSLDPLLQSHASPQHPSVPAPDSSSSSAPIKPATAAATAKPDSQLDGPAPHTLAPDGAVEPGAVQPGGTPGARPKADPGGSSTGRAAVGPSASSAGGGSVSRSRSHNNHHKSPSGKKSGSLATAKAELPQAEDAAPQHLTPATTTATATTTAMATSVTTSATTPATATPEAAAVEAEAEAGAPPLPLSLLVAMPSSTWQPLPASAPAPRVLQGQQPQLRILTTSGQQQACDVLPLQGCGPGPGRWQCTDFRLLPSLPPLASSTRSGAATPSRAFLPGVCMYVYVCACVCVCVCAHACIIVRTEEVEACWVGLDAGQV